MEENKWVILHRYQDLVRLGQARDLTCPECKNMVTFILDKDTEPLIWCVFENTVYDLGTKFWGDLRSVVSEFYVE